jgi:hypothetical protein
MLIKKSDVKAHLAARRARHLELLTKSPNSLGSAGVSVQSEPMRANAYGSTLEPIRLVPRVRISPTVRSAPSAGRRVPAPAVEKPTHCSGTTTVFKPSEW